MTRAKLASISVALLSLLLLCCFVPLAGAQTATQGNISGTVTDPTNAVVPDATVTIHDVATGQTRTTTTNSAGRYAFVNVLPGHYDMSITKQGFAKISQPGMIVEVGQSVTNNVALKMGSENQTIEVATTGVELQTDNATVGSTVNGIALQSLPSIARDTSTFLTLQPGISPDGSVAGAVVDQSTFQLDGGSNTNDMDGSMSVYTTSYAGDPTGGVANQSNGVAAGATGVMPTPADSVEEFKVNVAGQSADFNSSAGAQVQIVTKRGTNQWHGTAYEYYLDNNLNANTYQNNFSGVPNPNYHYSRFGGAVGGPIISKNILGGKTYIFANYQGFRWPNSTTVERAVPSDSMRLGLLTFGGTFYNLNPYAVTYKGTSYAAGNLDPRGIGINPLMQKLWSQYEPLPNEGGGACGLSRCDINKAGFGNIGGYLANISIPQNDNFGVVRLDHDFGQKWHFMSSYRYYKLTKATTDQVDIGGFFAGHTLGTPASLSNLPQNPWYLVGGVTGQLTNNITNNFVMSYLRNYWAWARAGGPTQFAGLGGALEAGGESATQALIPYNVNTQQTRTRYWDGQDLMFRDDVSWLKGKHLIQFGGLFQNNYDKHQRTDNGGGINYYPVYQLGTSSGAGISMKGYVPAGVPSSTWGRDYASVLGIVSISQIAYTRVGKDLHLNPPLTPATTSVRIPFGNFYGSDIWRLTPRLTLTYGLGWTVEMPPYETQGKQVIFVGPDNNPISTQSYMNARQAAALQGQVFNPQVGFDLIGNLASPRKYPYNPYYGEWSPRVALAYDLFGDGRTILRGGYTRTYGRLNGVDLVLVPLLGTGLIQPVQCKGAVFNNASAPCAGSGGANPTNAFRVGTDGMNAPLPPPAQTLPQPLYPGVNGVAAGAGEALDPNFRPNKADTVTFTFQRQLTNKVSLEIGYVGRWINHEYTPVNLNAVPYMMTKGGQTFAKAYANTIIQYCGNGDVRNLGGGDGSGFNCAFNAAAVTPQPFFEAALAGTGYCNGFANCTQAVIANEGGVMQGANVWQFYSDLDNGGFNFPRSMMNTPLSSSGIGSQGQLTSGVGMNASLGHGNYNAMLVTLRTSDWKGVSLVSNFTWSKALGTGAEVQATSADTLPNPFNVNFGYGLQAWDRPLVFNLYSVYQPHLYKSQSGVLGHLLGGWTIAPIFTAGSGLPITIGTANGGGQAFGEGDSVNFVGYGNSENAVMMTQLPSAKRYNNTPGDPVTGIGTSGYGVNIFKDPVAAWNMVRQPLLGYDGKNGGFGVYRGLKYWNVDLSVKKMFKITERFSTEFQAVFTNLFNHNQFGDPPGDYLDTSSPNSWGTLPGTVTNTSPRQMEFGIRLNF